MIVNGQQMACWEQYEHNNGNQQANNKDAQVRHPQSSSFYPKKNEHFFGGSQTPGTAQLHDSGWQTIPKAGVFHYISMNDKNWEPLQGRPARDHRRQGGDRLRSWHLGRGRSLLRITPHFGVNCRQASIAGCHPFFDLRPSPSISHTHRLHWKMGRAESRMRSANARDVLSGPYKPCRALVLCCCCLKSIVMITKVDLGYFTKVDFGIK